MQGVEKPGEEDDVGLGHDAEDGPEGLEEAAEKVDIVEAGQSNQQKIERIAHV